MIFEIGSAAAIAFLLARLVFGALVAFQGLNHVLQRESMAGYAEAKGIPAPMASVLASGLLLVVGGLGIAAGVFPLAAALALVVFFVVVTPTMHDFWRQEGEAAQSEMTHFIKNVELLAASLVFLALATQPWPYVLGVSL